jgi:hypothetical protein
MGMRGDAPADVREYVSHGRPTLFARLGVKETGLSQCCVTAGERRWEDRRARRAVERSVIGRRRGR